MESNVVPLGSSLGCRCLLAWDWGGSSIHCFDFESYKKQKKSKNIGCNKSGVNLKVALTKSNYVFDIFGAALKKRVLPYLFLMHCKIITIEASETTKRKLDKNIE